MDSATNRTGKTNRSERRAQRKERKTDDSAWLQEDENEDPLDLLDPMAIKHVLATRPLTKEQIEKKKEKKVKNGGFKATADGRLMIEDSDESDDADVKSRKSGKSSGKKKKQPDQIDEMMDTLSIGKKSSASLRKKKRSLDADDSCSDTDDEAATAKSDKRSSFKYKAGGAGIHRKLDKNKQSVPEFGSEYKAKVLNYFY
jgi:hypothetical protein